VQHNFEQRVTRWKLAVSDKLWFAKARRHRGGYPMQSSEIVSVIEIEDHDSQRPDFMPAMIKATMGVGWADARP